MLMKRCITILLLSAIAVMTGSCDKFVLKVWTGPQSNLVVPAQCGILFPELCYVSYGGKTYSYSEDRYNDAYKIRREYLSFGVECYTHLSDDPTHVAEDFGRLSVGIRGELNLDENEPLSLGEYPALLSLGVYELSDGEMKYQSISFRDVPCTLVIDELSPAGSPVSDRYPFKWLVKAHIAEEDIEGSSVHIEINMKFF